MIVDLELPVLQRLAQHRFQLRRLTHILLHVGIEHLDPPTAASFGTEHGDIGMANHRLRRVICSVAQRDPHARSDLYGAFRDHEWGVQFFQDALGDCHRLAGVRDLVEQHDVLVAAQSSHRVQRTNRPRKHTADLDQQLVPDRVPIGVVDLLEAIEVDETQTEQALRITFRDADCLTDTIFEQCTRRQCGEVVVQRSLLELAEQCHPFAALPHRLDGGQPQAQDA